MRAPLSWLKEFVNLDLTNEELSDVLTLAGLEVDKMERTPFSFTKVIVGEIREVNAHPNADNLKVAQVFDGTETLQVVCGDPTCRAGTKTAFAQIGATLEGEEGKRIKIKRSKLRDIESFGMLCSKRELGLS
ncbi:MAG: Phenylalanine--tRNA ligase beta subunit, partial [Chlamydiae bacterium]|nr:Phenylalanine--tRNA ligase beta subunit [Chlamydiota bacterium]